jgi:hypothetical protein
MVPTGLVVHQLPLMNKASSIKQYAEEVPDVGFALWSHRPQVPVNESMICCGVILSMGWQAWVD